ncbi:MAG: AEC family transporter [Sphingobium sp.]
MLDTFLSVLPVFTIILIGYLAARSGIIPASVNRDLNRFVVWIALPALMFHIVATTDWGELWDGNFVIASLAGSLLTFALGMVIGRMRGLSLADMAVDGLNASYANSAYIGLPLFLLTLGPRATPYVIIGAALTLMVQFACAVLVIELGHHRHMGIGHALRKAAMGVIRNPVIAGPLAGFAWWLTGWPLPGIAEQCTRMLGAAASPTALVAIGLFLAERPLRQAISNRFVVMLTSAKLIFHPAVTALIAFPLLGMSSFTGTVAVAMGALPTGTGPFMVAAFYARDGKVTSGTILLSTILSVLSLTAILSLLPH